MSGAQWDSEHGTAQSCMITDCNHLGNHYNYKLTMLQAQALNRISGHDGESQVGERSAQRVIYFTITKTLRVFGQIKIVKLSMSLDFKLNCN